jgi:hypothetical protein
MQKELLEASVLAIVLAAGLATVSYSLFAETPSVRKLQPVLDLYTAKGGIGINANGGVFEPGDGVRVYAYLTDEGVRVNDSRVTFTINRPNGTQIARTALSNSSGIAETPLSFLPSEGQLIGQWQVVANASVNNKAVNDTMTLQCELENARIELSSKKNGAVSISFLPAAQVFLEARLSYRNASIADAPVAFEVKTPDDRDFLSPALTTVSTSELGTANLTFQIPWPSDSSLGTWRATVTGRIYGENVSATNAFDCNLVPATIDVYTEKGGRGLNTPSGTYVLNESIVLYAEVRDTINKTIPNMTVSFGIKFFNTTAVPGPTEFLLSGQTNASGIANASFRMYSDAAYVGTWVVYATVRYNDVVLIDALTFTIAP